ncbi:jg2945 [Pararge aegeria aegeria]|uniref:Jg2945 protein n=1 Tax=Pararge aegeria aegeria TaxID=348720 RepID=A0A8S4SLR5_9NEOP|nr:jg2945 [Pararge aegeria aegeria]
MQSSFHRFIEENRHKPVCSTPDESSNNFDIERVNKSDPFRTSIKVEHKSSKNNKDVDSQIFHTQSLMGPVVKLPVETIVMRFTPAPPCQHHLKKTQKTQNDAKSLKCQNNIKNKIDAACCMDSACLQRLSELDTAVNELRSRATKLARREADRVEVLERAEAAWKDLEMGFQRRLSLAEEKEDDMAKQIKKSIEERNSYKNISTNLAETLKERGDAAQQERERLRVFEKEVCDRACVRLQLSEESAKGDAALAEQLCRASQLDRDLQFKEEQARRKVTSLQSELESSQCLTYEAERAMRFELSALKEQITEVSKNLLAVEDNNNSIKVELDNFRQEKANIIEDLDGCKDICESRMKGRIDELNQKRELLKELKERVMECQCKLPQDVAVEVKRTPSLAALCHCTPEDKLLDSCSCTSLRSQLLSNLLSDLFGGLQTELGASGLLMPCGLLLCLDDRHNWDRASVVKSSLRNFFAQLLVGELDIAIATSIEKYHAKWVGASCADTQHRLIPDSGEDENEGWEQRAIERRAYKLATKLAEQLFEDRAEELKQKAKDIVSSGPPPCACERHQRSPAVFPCLVKTPVTKTAHKYGEVAPSYMRRAIQDVSCLKHQLQDLKKDSIKKEDLRLIEDKISKIIQQVSKVDHSPTTSKAVKCVKNNQEIIDGKNKTCDENKKNNDAVNFVRRKEIDKINLKKYVKKCSNNPLGGIDKRTNKVFKKLEQSFAVNLCLCSNAEAPNKLAQVIERSNNLKPSWKQKKSRDLITNVSNVKQSKPISTLVIKEKKNQACKLSTKTVCQSNCICFHKIPSNTSIDKLLETLSKWNGSLNKITEDIKLSHSGKEIENISQNKSLIDSESSENNKKENDESLKSINHTATICHASCKNVLPSSTESEYIGAINLDKSNYNICRCPESDKTVPHDGLFHCIKADTCKCKGSVLSGPTQESKLNKYVSSNIKNKSQVYSGEVDKAQFECIETETDVLDHQNKNSRNCQGVSEDFIQDLVRKSQLFPNSCDYLVKFLGVTLTNTSSLNESKQNHDDNILNTFSKEPNDQKSMKELSFKVNMKDNNKSSKCYYSLENCVDKDVNLEKTESNINTSKLRNENDDVCVCCKNNASLETSKDLELNAFNLLEEHIKKKLGECLQSSSKSSCITSEEENELFNTILMKVKEVISESTKGLICKHCEESTNQGSWSRAYGMLQEYLKVKIKRVQCSCVSSEGHVESILPSILKKVSDLIENDFQRLKKKCKNAIDDKKNTEKIAEDKIFCNEMMITKENGKEKDSCLHLDKSCKVFDSVSTNLSTAEKEVSCEFKIYGMDCNCKHKPAESSDLDKDLIVNQYTELISINDNAIKDILSTAEVNSAIISSRETKISPLIEINAEKLSFRNSDNFKPELNTKIPYIGCTLSTRSLVQNNVEKIEDIWKSLTDEVYATKCSYIMNKVHKNENSESNINIIYNNSKSGLNNLHSVNNDRKDICDIEISTYGSEEDIVLKYSSDNFNDTKPNISTFDERSTGTKSTLNVNSACMHECKIKQFINHNYYETDKFNKTFLYDSLHLPTTTHNFTKPNANENLSDSNNRSELEQDCDCKMVPICHVKMLVNNIEKKLIQTKCTCDSLSFQVCPVHA